ncbi:MAG TPA: hypothetical protein VLX28_06150, partial [Thermoanaerobaculia bacterium]|nr:hypothetical protein [Thermoanaerobaculia bacterium]
LHPDRAPALVRAGRLHGRLRRNLRRPTHMLRDLTLNYLASVLPAGRVGRILSRFATLLTLPFLWIDRVANRRPLSHYLASTTFLLVRKPDLS